MAPLDLDHVDVHGLRTALLTGGDGNPLLFLHGAGTFTGFPFAERWADRFRVVLPFHPGFGPSADDPEAEDVRDYLLHYLDLLDVLGLERVHVVGHSLGGWLAALVAAEQPQRVDRLVLVSPAGLHVPDHPTTDLFRIPPDRLPPLLVADPASLEGMLPAEPTVDMIVAQYREMSTLARLIWQRNFDPKLPQWLRRVSAPTLIVWGRDDAVIPVQQLETWTSHLPAAKPLVLDRCGHLALHENPESAEQVANFLSS